MGFDVLDDDGFRAMVLARIVEPTSKAEVVRVLDEIGAPAVSLRTLFRSLARSQARDYRGQLSAAAWAHSVRASGTAALVLYDVTTLHFERGDEDELRKVGMSKEHRVGPQVQVGLLVTPSSCCAETPLVRSARVPSPMGAMVVVAERDAVGANLNALEDAGFPSSSLADHQAPNCAATRPARDYSRPDFAWARARPPGSGGWFTSGSSSASSTTTRPSTP